MIGLLQRVTQASVVIDAQTIGSIDNGLVIFIGVERGDGEGQSQRLIERVLSYRVFPDDTGKMNRSVQTINGGLLLVPQFTLAADTRTGTRPSFTPAAEPNEGRRLFDYLVQRARQLHQLVATGAFGTDMQVHLVNDGPVTFWLQVNV